MDSYGLVGYPLKHSFSKTFFTEKFETENIDAEYLNFEIPQIDILPGIISDQPTLRGLNITIPYKEKIIPYLHRLDPQAKAVGAINVVKIIHTEGKTELVGYNTDVIGFQESFAPLLENQNHKSALILGTGGASKAVKKGLQNLGIEYTFVSRTPEAGQLSYKDLDDDILNKYSIVVNTSPLGTYPNVDEAPDIPYHLLSEKHVLFDLVYNPAETKFLKLGKERGATTKNGADMLKLQALAAWEIWTK